MKIRILTPLKHDGKNHAAGDQIELTDSDATALIECGAAELPGEDPEPEKTAKSTKAKADKAAADDAGNQ